jgi:hypothetical protein
MNRVKKKLYTELVVLYFLKKKIVTFLYITFPFFNVIYYWVYIVTHEESKLLN